MSADAVRFILAFALPPGFPPVLVLSLLGWREQGGTLGWGSGVLGQHPAGELWLLAG